VEVRGHAYTVEFRIYGEKVDPAAITKDLELQPCQVRINGSSRADGKILKGMWAFDGSDDESNWHSEWTSLEEGLAYVLDRLWTQRETIAKYKASADLIWWCGHFQNSFDGGPELSPSLLKRLGGFGVALYIDNYFHESDQNA
jgi:hypothetical protein